MEGLVLCTLHRAGTLPARQRSAGIRLLVLRGMNFQKGSFEKGPLSRDSSDSISGRA